MEIAILLLQDALSQQVKQLNLSQGIEAKNPKQNEFLKAAEKNILKHISELKEAITILQNPELKLPQLQLDITEWANNTFGNNRNPKSVISHLKKEVNELHESPSDIMEYADCVILLLNASALVGINTNQLIAAVNEKFEICKKRKWGRADENGVIEHIK